MSARALVFSTTLVLAGCGPAVRPQPHAVAAAQPAPAPAPAPPATRPAAVDLENACDAVCVTVGQACHRDRGSMKLSQVTRCVKACMADRLPEADRRCYLSRAGAKDRHARHMFCGHRLGWPRLRPGGCVPAASDGWVATRAVAQKAPCKPGFVGAKRYPDSSGQPHLAYCDGAGKLRVVLQRELAAEGINAPALQRVARSEQHLVVFRARRANCGAQLSVGIIDLVGHRATVRQVQLLLGTKRWSAPQLEVRADRVSLTVLERRDRLRDQLSLALEPDPRPASSGRCAKLRAKRRAGGGEDNAAHPCWGAPGDPDHCP